MDELEQKVLDRIKQESIQPKPRWIFETKESLYWVLALLFFAAGSIAFGTVVFLLTDNDWNAYQYLKIDFSRHLLASIPFFWIGVLFLFWVIAYFYFRSTRNGYRRKALYLAGGTIIVGSALGLLTYRIHLAEYAEAAASNDIPFYNEIVQNRRNLWSQPGRGLLAGTIIEVRDKNHFIIKDFNNVNWAVEGDSILWRRGITPATGSMVRIVGREENGGIFQTVEAKSWENEAAEQVSAEGNPKGTTTEFELLLPGSAN